MDFSPYPYLTLDTPLHNFDWDLSVKSVISHATINLSMVVEKENVAQVLSYLLTKPEEASTVISAGFDAIPVETELTTIKSSIVTKPVHPGIYLSGLLIPFDITKKNLQDSLRLTPTYVNDVLTGDKPLTAESALFLERHFKQLKRKAEFWVELQGKWDLHKLRSTKTFSYEPDHKLSDSLYAAE